MKLITSALLLHAKSLGENGFVITVFSEEIGKVKGFVRGGRKKQAELQQGTIGQLTRQRRLENQLGTLTWEAQENPGIHLVHPKRLAVLHYVTELLNTALPEEHSYPALYQHTRELLKKLPQLNDDMALAQHLIQWELAVLQDIGYGLSLTPDVAVPCPQQSPLAYVSPNSGRAVSVAVGEDYADKLLTLPHMLGGLPQTAAADVHTCFQLTAFFLQRALHGQRVVSRDTLINQLTIVEKTEGKAA